MRPRSKVKAAEAVCPNCRQPAAPEFASDVAEDSPLAARPLSQLGIPAYDILRVEGPSDSGFFLLAADREYCHTGRESHP
jgi:adenylyltransferase/sulfurtransferase